MKGSRRNYKFFSSSFRRADTILPKVLGEIEKKYKSRPEKIEEVWAEILGEKLAPFTKVISWEDGILIVQVKGSTLYSLLHQYEKGRILKILQKRFSKETIRKMVLRLE